MRNRGDWRAFCIFALALVGCSKPAPWPRLCPATFDFSPARPPAWSAKAKSEYELREYQVCPASAATPSAAVEKELIVYTARHGQPSEGYASVDYYLLTRQNDHWRRDLMSRSEFPVPGYYREGIADQLMREPPDFELTRNGNRIVITSKTRHELQWIAELHEGREPAIQSVLR